MNCFTTVFPNLPPNEVESSNAASMAEWDSLATVTLIAVMEEEFECRFNLEEMEILISFEIILEIIKGKLNES